jgi:hypothetical protein
MPSSDVKYFNPKSVSIFCVLSITLAMTVAGESPLGRRGLAGDLTSMCLTPLD